MVGQAERHAEALRAEAANEAARTVEAVQSQLATATQLRERASRDVVAMQFAAEREAAEVRVAAAQEAARVVEAAERELNAALELRGARAGRSRRPGPTRPTAAVTRTDPTGSRASNRVCRIRAQTSPCRWTDHRPGSSPSAGTLAVSACT
ncbi:MAG: hypothetical protein LC713_01780, partial [Actinobacteria bacterium]|nr:hypothetical protein [Actinomycetota bacterium]